MYRRRAERPITVVRIIDRLNVGGPALHVALASAGLDDILLTFNVLGRTKTARLAALARRARLTTLHGGALSPIGA